MAHKAFDPAVTDLGQAIGLLVRRARATSASEELSWTETAVLKCLAKQGSQTTADLARAQGMRPQSMRTIVATLEQMRMVERKPHPTDGRQVNIGLTVKGAAEQKNARDAKRTWLAEAISQLGLRDRKTLFKAAGIMKRLAEK